MKDKSVQQLEERIQELEEKIDHLRFSRRVLMNLIERLEREKWGSLAKLERENKKLQLNNTKYARSLWRKNRQIMELEIKLQKSGLFEKLN